MKKVLTATLLVLALPLAAQKASAPVCHNNNPLGHWAMLTKGDTTQVFYDNSSGAPRYQYNSDFTEDYTVLETQRVCAKVHKITYTDTGVVRFQVEQSISRDSDKIESTWATAEAAEKHVEDICVLPVQTIFTYVSGTTSTASPVIQAIN